MLRESQFDEMDKGEDLCIAPQVSIPSVLGKPVLKLVQRVPGEEISDLPTDVRSAYHDPVSCPYYTAIRKRSSAQVQ
jgi:hypothetical protein